jgi:large subunit ribosomal protein L3
MAQKAIVGEKVGMTQVWGEDQRVIPVTVLRVEPARVVQVKTNDHDGYNALQVTYGSKKSEKLSRPEAGHFAKANVDPGRRLVELRLDSPVA